MIGWLRRNFLTGLVTVAPLAITGWVLWRVYGLIEGTMRPWVQAVPTLHETYPEFFLTLAGTVVVLLLITLVGAFTRNLIGVAFLRLVERVVTHIPVVKSMYLGLKQIAAVLFQDQRRAFRQAVLFEYPRPGVWSLGFVTRDPVGDELFTVFLPTTPNPTSGYLLLLPRDQLRVLDIPVEEAVKLVVSGGSIMDEDQAARVAAAAASLAARGAGPAPEEGTT